MATSAHATEQDISLGIQLLDASEQEAFSFLGIQAEKLEISEARIARGKAMPPWTNDDAIAKVLSKQRASKEELLRYFNKGMEFARSLVTTLEGELRGVLCEGKTVRKELLDLQDSTKEVIRYVTSLVIGVLLAALPGAVALAITSIATVIAVILIKRNLTQFCALGAQVIA